MTQDAAVHLTVQGRVQGVGYRYFAQEAALSLGITGWVRNCPDGTVEARGEGPAAELQRWIDTLRQGPPLSCVEHVAVQWTTARDETSSFSIVS